MWEGKATTSNMYADTKTWNPFVGCRFQCIYCRVSFQRQLKRWGKGNCRDCYDYAPHRHPERLNRIPSSRIVFCCGDGDIAFCDTDFLEAIVQAVSMHNRRSPYKTYYFQSKDWVSAGRVIPFLEEYVLKNAVILETLETNRDESYGSVSMAPRPTLRHKAFREVAYERKVVTVEPILDFDLDPFFRMISEVEPEYVWIGYNSKPNLVRLPEPNLEKTITLIRLLEASGIQVKAKDLRSALSGERPVV
jgi:hypothetical protein